MPQAGIARVAAAAAGAAILSGTIVVSTAVVADRLETGLAVNGGQPRFTQSYQVDRTNKGDALTIKNDADSKSETPSVLLPGCESAFASPSPEFLTRKPSRCLTDLAPLAGGAKFAALHRGTSLSTATE